MLILYSDKNFVKNQYLFTNNKKTPTEQDTKHENLRNYKINYNRCILQFYITKKNCKSKILIHFLLYMKGTKRDKSYDFFNDRYTPC